MRKLIIAGNWKMYAGTADESNQLAKGLVGRHGQTTAVDIVLCPPFTALRETRQAIQNSKIGLGAQNMYPRNDGAFTGEISPQFLLDCGCQYVILGHSERRTLFSESNQFINQKVRFALEQGLTPIMCLGETEQQREAGKTESVVEDHIRGGLKDISTQDMKKIVLAYEPVWAIGTGKTATPDDAQSVHAFIRRLLVQLYDQATADAVRIQYGGSVKPDNAKELLTQPDIDGALVGGASLKAETFAGIIENSGAL